MAEAVLLQSAVLECVEERVVVHVPTVDSQASPLPRGLPGVAPRYAAAESPPLYLSAMWLLCLSKSNSRSKGPDQP